MKPMRLFRRRSTERIVMRAPYADGRNRIRVGTIEITITDQDELAAWLALGAIGSCYVTARLQRRV